MGGDGCRKVGCRKVESKHLGYAETVCGPRSSTFLSHECDTSPLALLGIGEQFPVQATNYHDTVIVQENKIIVLNQKQLGLRRLPPLFFCVLFRKHPPPVVVSMTRTS